MPPSLEDRIRALEGFRYRALGRINAQSTLLLAAWQMLLKHHFDDPIATAEGMRDKWLQAAEAPPPFPGVDPAHLDAVSQEYRQALEELTKVLVELAHGLAKDRGQRGNK